MLRELIMTGRLRPGQSLLQTKVAEQLGISRTPLREAFCLLEREGLIRYMDGSHTVQVVEYGVREICELYEMREVLDGLAARLVAERGLSRHDDQELQEKIADMREASNPFDPIRHSAAHAEFHGLIAHLAGNRRLQGYMDTIAISFQLLATRLMRASEGDAAFEHVDLQSLFAASLDQHQSILDAIKSRNGRLAEHQARRHIRAAMRSPVLIDESGLYRAAEAVG
jgi:GntR family transcriptional regulator of vanillate catabolism